MTLPEMQKEVEHHLKAWRREQMEVWAVEQDAASLAFSSGDGEPVQSSSISDKTARGAMLLQGIEEKRTWVECIAEAMRWLKRERPDLYSLLYGHYGMGHDKGYRRKTARSFAKSYCTVYRIGDTEYFNRRREGLSEVVSFAVEYGLLRRCKQFNSELTGKKPW